VPQNFIEKIQRLIKFSLDSRKKSYQIQYSQYFIKMKYIKNYLYTALSIEPCIHLITLYYFQYTVIKFNNK